MMFGMPDDNQGAAPTTPSATQPGMNEPVTSIGGAPGVPTAPPTTPTASNDSAGDFIMDDPGQKNETQANTSPAGTNPPSTTPVSDGLLAIKQQALQQLSPLVDHLEQTPEEEFRTTMMMIQASDDQSLLQKAYDAAQKIEDDKIRAQALLDIINEINYFTQHKNGEEKADQ